MLTLRITGGSFNSRTDEPNSIVVTDVKEYAVHNKEYMLQLVPISTSYKDDATGEPAVSYTYDIIGFDSNGSPNERVHLAPDTPTPLVLSEWKERAIANTPYSNTQIAEMVEMVKGLTASHNMSQDQYSAYEALLWLGATPLKYVVVTFANGEEKGYYTRQVDPIYVMNENGKTIDRV